MLQNASEVPPAQDGILDAEHHPHQREAHRRPRKQHQPHQQGVALEDLPRPVVDRPQEGAVHPGQNNRQDPRQPLQRQDQLELPGRPHEHGAHAEGGGYHGLEGVEGVEHGQVDVDAHRQRRPDPLQLGLRLVGGLPVDVGKQDAAYLLHALLQGLQLGGVAAGVPDFPDGGAGGVHGIDVDESGGDGGVVLHFVAGFQHRRDIFLQEILVRWQLLALHDGPFEFQLPKNVHLECRHQRHHLLRLRPLPHRHQGHREGGKQQHHPAHEGQYAGRRKINPRAQGKENMQNGKRLDNVVRGTEPQGSPCCADGDGFHDLVLDQHGEGPEITLRVLQFVLGKPHGAEAFGRVPGIQHVVIQIYRPQDTQAPPKHRRDYQATAPPSHHVLRHPLRDPPAPELFRLFVADHGVHEPHALVGPLEVA
mmetsp:Transcript_13664/g.30595  ORF Transcript_13664/g.30595 Transcript_13664/m.30595 type:complete len:421 (-) Transcript_13664:86-1348(-)